LQFREPNYAGGTQPFVTNALDSVDGTWATVDLASGTAHVRSKKEIDEAALARAVKEAGYRLA
jgi:copper chaperone CopZ